MTITEIYETFTAGSQGFTEAVETHCGIEASRDEIERIADRADNAAEFMAIWENETWWRDGEGAQTINQRLIDLRDNSDEINDAIREFFNCREGEMDNEGDIWIADPQSGHWIGDDEKSRFLAWAVSQ